MEITTNTNYTITASEGYWLTQKEVEMDNYRTFSKSFVVSSEEEADRYEEWSDERKRNFEGIEETQNDIVPNDFEENLQDIDNEQ